MVGVFNEESVIRVEVVGDHTFAELLAQVRERNLAAYEHWRPTGGIPFDVLVERLTSVRSQTHYPLVQVELAWQDFNPRGTASGGDLILDDIDVTLLKTDYHLPAILDLEIFLGECWGEGGDPAGISGSAVFRADVFDASSIELLLGRFETLLTALTTDPARPLVIDSEN